MPAPKQLLSAHLEKVSISIFEEYPEVVRDLIKGHSGIYALFKGDRLYYIGLASNLMIRLKKHKVDRHYRSWTHFSIYLTRDSRHMKELESLLIRISYPIGNRQGGKFSKSNNLAREFKRRMKIADADKRSRLVGGQVHRLQRRRNKNNERGSIALAGFLDRRRSLRAEYKGWIYSATLRKDGRISYDGNLYDTPSAAAKAIVKKGRNGWKFWKYRDSKEGWVSLNQLRK